MATNQFQPRSWLVALESPISKYLTYMVHKISSGNGKSKMVSFDLKK